MFYFYVSLFFTEFDFGLSTGTVVFEPGDLSQTIQIPITDDIILEDDESFSVTLVSMEQNVIVPSDRSNATVTIFDNDRELKFCTCIHSGTHENIGTPMGQKEVSVLERCPYFRG